jgi:hypothetical protein
MCGIDMVMVGTSDAAGTAMRMGDLFVSIALVMVVALPDALAQLGFSEETHLGAGARVETGPIPAPRGALEIGVQGGYTHPFGEIARGVDVEDLVDAGGDVGLEIGYRASPRWSASVVGIYQQSTAATPLGVANTFRGAVAALEATLHFLPYERVDPHVSLGAGYRCLGMELRGEDNDAVLHGLEIGRLVVGLDFRLSPHAAVGPRLSADLNMLLWNDAEGASSIETLSSPRPSTFLYAGLAARFDLLGTREVDGVAARPGRSAAR